MKKINLTLLCVTLIKNVKIGYKKINNKKKKNVLVKIIKKKKSTFNLRNTKSVPGKPFLVFVLF